MARDDLKAALTEISGIGDSRAEEILTVVNEYDGGSTAPDDDLAELIQNAHEYHEVGDHEYAAKFVRRLNECVEGQ